MNEEDLPPPPQKQFPHPLPLLYPTPPCPAKTINGFAPKSVEGRMDKNYRYARQQQQNEPWTSLVMLPGFIPLTIGNKPLSGHYQELNGKPVAVAFCQGRKETKDKMEDEHLVTDLRFQVENECYQGDLFGVFDGHRGEQAARFVKENLQTYLKRALEQENKEKLTIEGIFNALKACCKSLDAHYVGTDGTTATIAFVFQNQIFVTNVGDSRVFVIQNKEAFQLTEDAQPSLKRYEKTIKKLKGIVSFNQVNGRLGMARSIGDHDVVGEEGQCCVSPSPKITSWLLKPKEECYLVLASDGLFVASTDNIGRIIHEAIEMHMPLEQIAKRLVYSMNRQGSVDDMTVIIVKL